MTTSEVAEYKLNYTDTELSAFVAEASRLCDSDNGRDDANFGHVLYSPSISSTEVWKDTRVFDLLFDTITSYGRYYLNYHHAGIFSAWTVKYMKDQYTVLHGHVEASASFCFYLNDSTTPIIFDGGLSITPSKNTLLIFPGHLKHSVPPHKENNPRIALIGNFKAQYYDCKTREDS